MSRRATDVRRGRPLRVLFRVAAGPRRGYGHLLRAVRLSRALGIGVRVSIRGGVAAERVASRFRAAAVRGGRRGLLRRLDPEVLVVDDPSRRCAAPWFREARRHGVLTVGLHDLGLGCLEGDVVFDGSVGGPWASHFRSGARVGPDFAILDPAVASLRWQPRRIDDGRQRPRILVALGGGSRLVLVERIARELRRAIPGARVRVLAGFDRRGRVAVPGVRWLGALPTLAPELAAADVAIVAGGVTAYEACAVGVPAIAVAVVRSQRPTITALASLGAVIDGGLLDGRATRNHAARVADEARRLVASPSRTRQLSRVARSITDGRGVHRVAASIVAAMAHRGRQTEAAW